MQKQSRLEIMRWYNRLKESRQTQKLEKLVPDTPSLGEPSTDSSTDDTVQGDVEEPFLFPSCKEVDGGSETLWFTSQHKRPVSSGTLLLERQMQWLEKRQMNLDELQRKREAELRAEV
jgi:hypothetical protein